MSQEKLNNCVLSVEELIHVYIIGTIVAIVIGTTAVVVFWHKIAQRTTLLSAIIAAVVIVISFALQRLGDCHAGYFRLVVAFCCARTVSFVADNAYVSPHAYEKFRRSPRQCVRTAIGRVATVAFVRYALLSMNEFFLVATATARVAHIVGMHPFWGCAPSVCQAIGFAVFSVFLFDVLLSDFYTHYVFDKTTVKENMQMVVATVASACLFSSCGSLGRDDIDKSVRVAIGATAVLVALALLPVYDSEVVEAPRRVYAGKVILVGLAGIGAFGSVRLARSNRPWLSAVGAAWTVGAAAFVSNA